MVKGVFLNKADDKGKEIHIFNECQGNNGNIIFLFANVSVDRYCGISEDTEAFKYSNRYNRQLKNSY